MVRYILVLIFFIQAAFSQFDTLWTKTYFFDEDTLDFIGKSLQPTLDGGFVILGEQTSENIEPEIFLLKADSDGENLWTTMLPHTTYDKVRAYSIDDTPDSGFVVLTMESNYSCYDDFDLSSISILVLFRLDALGDTLWTRSYLQDYFNDQFELCFHRFEVIASGYGELLLYGSYFVGEEQKTWLLKTNALGEPIWENTYDYNNTEAVTLDPDGSIFITGGHGIQGSPGTAYILKINSNGEQEWVQYESGPLNTNGRIIHSTIDNGFVVYGQYSSGYNTGPWLWKTDSLGNTEWDINLDDEGINGLANLVQHSDGTYIMAGYYGQGVFSYLLLNTNDSTSNSFTYEGLYYQAIDIKSISENTQATLINSDLYNIGIVKTLYTGSNCVADDGTAGVELWGECYSIDNTTELNLSNIGLTGTIPPEIGNLTNLTILNLGDNQLTGVIPQEIWNLTNLNILNLRSNELTGSISPDMGNLINLTYLNFGYNQLTGDIHPEIGNLTNLTELNLVYNQLTGIIPDEICNQGDSSPSLFNNQLCPPYPECIEEYVGDQDTTNCEQVSIIDETLSFTYALYNAYPNPFNPVTTLRYDLPKNGLVNITIYDTMGRVASNLVSNQQRAGYKSIQWNATNNQGEPVFAGVYLYKIQAGDFVDAKKMILLK